jgi:hypothetical protein
MAIRETELPPDAARVIEGLRDTGYEFTTAVADIIDNSIAADADRVAVRFGALPSGEIELSIADNGTGMTSDDLLYGMQYGSPARPSAKSLGKFGLGLKTASTAMARQLLVITRSEAGEVSAAQWDLDYVVDRHKWLLQHPEPSPSDLDLLDEAADGGTGTVVIWRKVDRVVPRNYKNAGSLLSAIKRQEDTLRQHLALTYVRYISGDAGPEVRIKLNGRDVSGWDPFGRSLGSEVLLDQEVPVEIDGAPAAFRVRAYVLPPRSELTPEQLDEARISSALQGFYVFREDRVITAGDWLGMYRDEPHFSLCRIDFSFDHRLDEALQIDIKKSRIRMLAALHDEVKQLVAPARYEAEERYRKNERTQIVVESGDLHSSSNAVLTHRADDLARTAIEVTGDGQAVVRNPRGEVTITIPTVRDASGGPHVVVREDLQEGLLWQPGIVDGKHAVLLNGGHPFYQRFYLANAASPVAVQGANFLLWALCEAELYAVSTDEREHMAAVRREVSRILRELAKELPEVETAA